jgi:hypothetical protein
MSQLKKGGRPPKYKTIAEFRRKVGLYFETCMEEGRPFTFGGLALFLGYYDVHSLKKQELRSEAFASTIKLARMLVEQQKHEHLIDGVGSTRGLIFDLINNHGWKDKSEVDVTTGGESINKELSDDELKEALKGIGVDPTKLK